MNLLVILLAGCKKEAPIETPAPGTDEATEPTEVVAPPSPAPTEAVEAVVLTPAEEELLRALSARDQAPDCATLSAMVPDPVASFTTIVEKVQMPPAAPMRAARCLLTEHTDAAADTIEGWLRSEGTEGLARLVLGELDHLAPEQAARFGRAALEGPYSALARPELESSELAEVRALVQ